MYGYGMGQCVGCGPSLGVSGLGTIVMEPLRGGFGQGNMPLMTRVQSYALTAGAAAPAAYMLGAAASYGAVSGLASRSWKKAGTGALLGSGIAGLMSGLGLMAVSAAAEAPSPAAPPIPPEGVEGLRQLAAPGAMYAIAGAGLLAWGGYRAWKQK